MFVDVTGNLAKRIGLDMVLRICGLLLLIAGLLFYAVPYAVQGMNRRRAAKAATTAATQALWVWDLNPRRDDQPSDKLRVVGSWA